ncbi:MAG: hypothetical protein ABIB04_01755 [Patescibacteria group bacterium]
MKKLFYVGLSLLGIGIMVGVVLFLRSRNMAGLENGGTLLNKPVQTGKKADGSISPKAMPYTPIEEVPFVPPYKPGDEPPPETESIDMISTTTNQ